jgi:uncharacterized membrane protein
MSALTADSRTSRRAYTGLWVLGTVAFVGLMIAGQPVAGGVAFLLAGALSVALSARSDAIMFDERDREVFSEAGRWTIAVVGLSSAVVFPGMTILQSLGYVEWPVWFYHYAWFIAGLFALWFVMVLTARYQR